MKRCLLTIVLLLLIQCLHAQKFTVVNVFDGQAGLAGRKEPLKKGAILPLKAKLWYSHTSCTIVFTADGKGPYTLSAKHDPRAGLARKTSFLRLLWEDLVPLSAMTTTGARAAFLANSPADLGRYLANHERPVLVWEQLQLTLNASAFPDRTQRYFFLQETIGQAISNIRLPYAETGHTGTVDLIISANDLLRFSQSKATVRTYQLYYYNETQQHADPVGLIELRVVNGETLRQELNMLTRAFPRNRRSEIAFNYLNQFYGDVTLETLRERAPEIF